MKKPKSKFKWFSTYYTAIDGRKILTTAKYGSPLSPGEKWHKETNYGLELHTDRKDPPWVNMGYLEMTPEKDIEISKWFQDVAKFLKHKDIK